MRVVVDHSAAFNQGAGIGRYARNLVPALARALPSAELTLWYAPEPGVGARFAADAVAPFADTGGVRVKRARLDRRRMDQLWFRARVPLPIEAWVGRQDLVYSPDFTAPPSRRAPRVVTVHDLAFEIVPERAPDALRRYLSAVVPRQVREAAAIAAVSETTKRDLVARMSVDPERITVVPNAVDDRFFQAEPIGPEQRSGLGIPERYLLTVGTIEPRKNHRTIFEALRLISPLECPPLVVVGRIGWSADDIMAEARDLERRGRVILLEYVADDLLPGIYAGAEALVYVSWYEGFGLPILEGLAAGIPVIASDVPAHREVAGDCAMFVPPGDPVSLAERLIEVASGRFADLAQVPARRERARRYSWTASGEVLAGLLTKVVSS